MSSRTDRIFAEFDGSGSLPGMMERLLAAQKKAWPDLQKNCLSLEKRLVRELSSGKSALRVEFNPGRINSTSANTDARAVSKQALFPLPGQPAARAERHPVQGRISCAVQSLPDF